MGWDFLATPDASGWTAMAELRLGEPQRRAIGVRLRAISEAVQTLRRAGLDPDALDAIEQLVGDAADAAQVPPPLPQNSLVAAMVAEILIAAAEIRPGNLRRYGDLEEDSARRLERLSARLTELADSLEVFTPAVPRHGSTRAGV
jgi:hypothetical protein